MQCQHPRRCGTSVAPGNAEGTRLTNLSHTLLQLLQLPANRRVYTTQEHSFHLRQRLDKQQANEQGSAIVSVGCAARGGVALTDIEISLCPGLFSHHLLRPSNRLHDHSTHKCLTNGGGLRVAGQPYK